MSFLLIAFYWKNKTRQKSWSGSFVELLLKWKKTWFEERFDSWKQMFDIHKMSPLLLRIFTVYDFYAPRKLSKDSQENILGGVILVIATLNSQSVIRPKEGLCHQNFSGNILENGWLWTAAFEQSKIAACNVIRFLTIKISFGIML